MKNKFYQFVAVAVIIAILSTVGCKKYTEVDPVSQYNVAQAFSDVSNAFTALVGVYDELQGDNGYGIRISMYYPYDTDEGIVSGNIDNGRRGIGRYQLLLTNAELTNPFRQLYRQCQTPESNGNLAVVFSKGWKLREFLNYELLRMHRPTRVILLSFPPRF